MLYNLDSEFQLLTRKGFAHITKNMVLMTTHHKLRNEHFLMSLCA